MNPLTKLALSVVLCAACFVSDNHLYVLGVIAFNLLMGALAGIGHRSVCVLRTLLRLSAVLFVVQVLFVREGRVLITLPMGLYVTDEGVAFSLLFSLRLMAATMPLTLMLSVTPMSDLANALVGRLGVPYRYTFALTTAIRFIPIFSNEMADIMEAQTARGVEFDTKNFFKKIRLLLPLCVPLLISSVKRIDNGAVAAELRGFNCRGKKSGYKQYRFGALDLAAVLTAAVVFALGLII
jgi:energy-coupling factor transport system permease protein